MRGEGLAPGHVVSGGQVLGCDWAWANPSGDFATWASLYPAEPARQHGVRFEGEYVPEGPGGGIPRIYEWALNVTDPHKTCDYSLFSEIPPQTKCPGPTIKSPPTDVPCSYVPDSGNANPLFRVMYVHIHLTEGDVPGLEGRETPAKGYYLPDDTKTSTPSPQVAVVSKQKPCTECQIGTVSCFDIGFDPLLIPSWKSQIFATQEDIRHFRGTAKIQLLIADYYYELEQWHEAKRRYARIHEEHYDRLDTTAKAYLDLVRAHCEMLTGGSKTAFPMFKKFETQYRNTPSWDRAMSVLFSYYQNKPETYDKAADALLQIYDKMPDTAKGRHTLVMLGVFYHCKGRYGEAVKTFELCLEKCPEYAKSVTDYLAEAKNRQAAQ